MIMKATVETILAAAANGNGEALRFLVAYARRAHWVDDLRDEEERPTPDRLAVEEADWLLTLSGNPFFLAHRAQLVPVMLLGLNAWVDSHVRPDHERDVVKGFWHETVWLVAWLTGGWSHLREVTGKYREYDHEGPVPIKVMDRNEADVRPH